MFFYSFSFYLKLLRLTANSTLRSNRNKPVAILNSAPSSDEP